VNNDMPARINAIKGRGGLPMRTNKFDEQLADMLAQIVAQQPTTVQMPAGSAAKLIESLFSLRTGVQEIVDVYDRLDPEVRIKLQMLLESGS
jgi:hypothetical protein